MRSRYFLVRVLDNPLANFNDLLRQHLHGFCPIEQRDTVGDQHFCLTVVELDAVVSIDTSEAGKTDVFHFIPDTLVLGEHLLIVELVAGLDEFEDSGSAGFV